MQELATPAGLVALAAAAVALVTLLAVIALAIRLRRVRRAQRVVLGDSAQDLVGHSALLQDGFDQLAARVQQDTGAVHDRLSAAEARLDGAIAYRALVRYDAYNEMSGRQSTSIALLDASGSGVVLSSIHHREQARLYTKQVHDGQAELELSPEEAEAVRLALTGGQGATATYP